MKSVLRTCTREARRRTRQFGDTPLVPATAASHLPGRCSPTISKRNESTATATSTVPPYYDAVGSSERIPRSPPAPHTLLSPSLSHRPSLTSTSDDLLRKAFDDPHFVPSFLYKPPPATTTRKETGIFGHSTLRSPDDFPILALRTVRRATLLVSRICSIPIEEESSSAEEKLFKMVKNLDRLSDLLCGVIDLAELVRNVHGHEDWVERANEAYEGLCEYMNTLNTHVGLYQALREILSPFPSIPSPTRPDLFSAHTVALQFLRDFEKSGIHLPTEQRTQFVELSNDILQLGRRFLQDVGEGRQSFEVGWDELSSGDGEGNTAFVTRLFEGYPRRGNKKLEVEGGSWQASTLLRQHPNENVRKKAYVAMNTSGRRQVETLEELLVTRNRLAKLVGNETWGHVALTDKMAKKPENVVTFLKSLAAHNRRQATADLSLLQRSKKNFLGLPTSSRDPTINAWDRDFYTDVYLQELYMSKPRPSASIAPYFSVGTCLQGLSRLFSSIYGIRFEPQTVDSAGEIWHDSVRKLAVYDEEEGLIGYIYCDLFGREGKTSGAAHYTVRCSRRTDDDDSETDFTRLGYPAGCTEVEVEGVNVPREEFEGLDVESFELRGREGRHQLPIIVLTCDFQSPTNGGGVPGLLSFQEVETLFHEMGHAIHSMIGRTEYHNVSGTRCATDFVELPSVLMEHFCSSPSVLSLFARHYSNDHPLPQEVFQAQKDHLRRFEGIETNAQILMAALDQAYHSDLPSSSDFDSTKTYHDIQEKFGIIPPPRVTTWQTQFGHLFGYGATYYSYLFDRALASQIWKEVFEKDPLSREGGDRYKKEVLRHGGGKQPWECVGGLLGNEELSRGDERAMEMVGQWGIESTASKD